MPLVSQVVSSWLITEAAKHGNEGNLDKYAIIASLAILAYMLQSVYMTIVTYACFLGAVAGSSGILYLIIIWADQEVSTTAPALMTPIGLAMSIDYCLFMMSRYRSERQAEWDTETAETDTLGTCAGCRDCDCVSRAWAQDDDPNQIAAITVMNETAGVVVSVRCTSVALTQRCDR